MHAGRHATGTRRSAGSRARARRPSRRLAVGAARIAALAVLVAPALARATPIEGTSWRLTSQDGRALAAQAPAPSVRFAAGRIEAFTGCNQAAGSYSIEGERLRVAPLAGTMMACEEPVMAIENAFKVAFAGTLGFEVAQDRLTLRSESGAVLVFEVEPPPTLAGVTWELTGFNNGREAVVSPLLGSALTLRFEEGVVVGHAGCNDYRAQATAEGDRIAIGAPAATRKHCPGEGVMAQEREFLAALHSATRWTIRRGLLDMHRADGARALTARPR